jgi:hypothetical protein
LFNFYKLARNVHWMVLYQICVFGADLKSNMASRVHNVFSLAEILKIFLSETTKSTGELKKNMPTYLPIPKSHGSGLGKLKYF